MFQQVIHYNKETKIKKLNCTGREKENVRSDQSRLVTVSNDFTKQRQNGFKINTRDKF